MSRGPKTSPYKTIQLSMDPDLAQALDITMVSFGIEDRASTVRMMMRAWLSSMSENTTINEIVQQSVRELRKAEFEALAKHYEDRASLFRAGAR